MAHIVKTRENGINFVFQAQSRSLRESDEIAATIQPRSDNNKIEGTNWLDKDIVVRKTPRRRYVKNKAGKFVPGKKE